MDRSVRHFEDELDTLQARLLEMGGLAEERVRAAVQGLVSRDVAVTDRVLQGDEPINQLHVEVDERCFRLLALYQPMATDLRAIVAGVKINSDLERVVGLEQVDAADEVVEARDPERRHQLAHVLGDNRKSVV